MAKTSLKTFLTIYMGLSQRLTQIGKDPYWALLTLSRDHYFRYRERSGRRHSLEAGLEESRIVAWILLYNMYYNVIILIYVCIKSNLLTLELSYIVDVFCEY